MSVFELYENLHLDSVFELYKNLHLLDSVFELYEKWNYVWKGDLWKIYEMVIGPSTQAFYNSHLTTSFFFFSYHMNKFSV